MELELRPSHDFHLPGIVRAVSVIILGSGIIVISGISGLLVLSSTLEYILFVINTVSILFLVIMFKLSQAEKKMSIKIENHHLRCTIPFWGTERIREIDLEHVTRIQKEITSYVDGRHVTFPFETYRFYSKDRSSHILPIEILGNEIRSLFEYIEKYHPHIQILTNVVDKVKRT